MAQGQRLRARFAARAGQLGYPPQRRWRRPQLDQLTPSPSEPGYAAPAAARNPRPLPAPKHAASGEAGTGARERAQPQGPNQRLCSTPTRRHSTSSPRSSAFGSGREGTRNQGEKEAGKAMWQVPLRCPEPGFTHRLGLTCPRSYSTRPHIGVKTLMFVSLGSLHCSLEIVFFRKGIYAGPMTSKLRVLLSDLSQAIVAEA